MREVWKGLGKIVEEAGELMQVLGKMIAFPILPHPDGGPALKCRAEDEIADLQAALTYFAERNELDLPRIEARAKVKLDKFRKWGLTGVPMEPLS